MERESSNCSEKSIVAGDETRSDEIQQEVDKIPRDLNYRFKFNEIFFHETIENIKEKPVDHFLFVVKKAVSFILIDFNSQDKNYYNAWHYIPVLIVGLVSIIGIVLSDKKSHNLNYLILLFLVYVGIYSLVSIMPRYKLMILPIQLIFFMIVIKFIFEKLKKFNSIMVRLLGFEPRTSWSVAKRSIQLSYRRGICFN